MFTIYVWKSIRSPRANALAWARVRKCQLNRRPSPRFEVDAPCRLEGSGDHGGGVACLYRHGGSRADLRNALCELQARPQRSRPHLCAGLR
jgi:hypothetical protein